MSDATWGRISAAIFDADLIATRMTLALAEVLWAILLWWPGEIFDRAAYAGMHSVMGEHAWGLVFALSAATQAGIVAMGHCNWGYARVFAGWNCVLWFYVVGSMLLSVYPPPAAIAGEIAMTVCAFWVWMRPILLCAWTARSHREGAHCDAAS